ncbi:MAG: holo-ACP synthase [Candidatus Cloacimonetes bacterium]|nr:holo-ACP synthase [Candidatus Cloacimonadota bacterium]
MIFGIGTDLVCIERIKGVIEKNPRFPERVFTPSEIDYCSAKANPYQSYAARFAAKEAFMKALGTGWNGVISWMDIEIFNTGGGKPEIRTRNATAELLEQSGISKIHVSLSHDRDYACAYVVLEKIDS